jgi:hypothetical protein
MNTLFDSGARAPRANKTARLALLSCAAFSTHASLGLGLRSEAASSYES